MAEYITVDKDVMSGEPVITGTRIPVRQILEFFSYRYSYDEIKAIFPYVKDEEIDACLEYASKVLSLEH